MSQPTSPVATRVRSPRWLDPRLVLGVLLVLVSVVVGARLLSSADDRTAVYAAARDLAPGQHVGADDLTVALVNLGGRGQAYVGAGAPPPVGYVVTRYVAAGELVPAAALAAGGAEQDTRLVTVPVQPGHLPDELGRGDLVDVYVTPNATGGAPAGQPNLVAAALPVEAREGGARTFSANATLSVVLSVPTHDVVRLVHAVESGTIDLVVVPPGAVQTTPTPGPSST